MKPKSKQTNEPTSERASEPTHKTVCVHKEFIYANCQGPSASMCVFVSTRQGGRVQEQDRVLAGNNNIAVNVDATMGKLIEYSCCSSSSSPLLFGAHSSKHILPIGNDKPNANQAEPKWCHHIKWFVRTPSRASKPTVCLPEQWQSPARLSPAQHTHWHNKKHSNRPTKESLGS